MPKLTARQVENAKKPGRYGDGAGLWLHVGKNGARTWVLRFMINGRAREMGLGPVALVSLAEARDRTVAARKLAKDGTDPLDHRRAERLAAKLEAAKSVTFKEAAERYIEAHKAGWKNAKHAGQWSATLQTYAYPLLGELPVARIDVDLVLKVLEPVWTAKPETASRLRGRIESVLDWATARNLRKGDNPARWRGHLDNLLPARSKVQAVRHHAALPYTEVAAFMKALDSQTGISASALAFAILTAARTGEVLGARWDEIDVEAALWTVPADRMKAAREHRVPLCKRALEIVRRMAAEHGSEGYVFPGQREGRPLSSMALLMLLRRMKRDDLTAHGFRSTFRDWAAEQANFPREIAEAALAHTLKDKTEAAYRRGDALEKRRKLMDSWSRYCSTPASANSAVVQLRLGTAGA